MPTAHRPVARTEKALGECAEGACDVGLEGVEVSGGEWIVGIAVADEVDRGADVPVRLVWGGPGKDSVWRRKRSAASDP